MKNITRAIAISKIHKLRPRNAYEEIMYYSVFNTIFRHLDRFNFYTLMIDINQQIENDMFEKHKIII